jgi:hypothetical protein
VAAGFFFEDIQMEKRLQLPIDLPEPGNKCGTCKLWFPEPRSIVDLHTEQVGECRFNPPAMTAIFQNGQIGKFTAFPLIKQSGNACSHYQLKIVTNN